MACKWGGNVETSMEEGKMHKLTRLVKRVFTFLQGLRVSSFKMLSWRSMIRAIRNSVEISVSVPWIWRAAMKK